jgi:3-deoxy-D-manno-octulosonic acid (KDO) 8-phosphate synthase
MPAVREIGKRIRNIAIKKNIRLVDMHIDNNDEICLIIPPLIKEKYPNGFDIETLIKHIQEHLYYISFFDKNNREPWKSYGHGDEGYLELYLENRDKYFDAFKEHFNCKTRPEFRRKLNELKRGYKK